MNVGFLVEKYQIELTAYKTGNNFIEIANTRFTFFGMKQIWSPDNIDDENYRNFRREHIKILTKETELNLIAKDIIIFKDKHFIIQNVYKDDNYGFLRFECVAKI